MTFTITAWESYSKVRAWVSAFGEVGLERASDRDRALQESTLRWVLGHAKEDVPLVLHLRGTKEDPTLQEAGVNVEGFSDRW